MNKIIFSLLLIINIAYSNSERYYIQLGSFKSLKGLDKNIKLLPYSLRSQIIVIRSNSWYIPFAYYVKSQQLLYPHVAKFKRYFPDAYINHSAYMLHHPIVKNYGKLKKYNIEPKKAKRTSFQPISSSFQNVAISEADNTLNRPLQFYTPSVNGYSTISRKHYKHFTKKMLSGNHYYLAYKSTKNSPNLLIKVTFKNHQVIYQPVIGDMQMTEANYLIENNRLYMFANTFTKNGAYSTLDSQRTNHFLVSSWVNGKKMNTLRYYYTLNEAKKYLGLATSKGLATVLESGNYDEFFLNESD